VRARAGGVFAFVVGFLLTASSSNINKGRPMSPS
jgi:hypothetical protein